MFKKSATISGPRYDARFRNGIWQVFDRIWYGVVGAEFTQKGAEARADTLNKRKAAPTNTRRAAR